MNRLGSKCCNLLVNLLVVDVVSDVLVVLSVVPERVDYVLNAVAF